MFYLNRTMNMCLFLFPILILGQISESSAPKLLSDDNGLVFKKESESRIADSSYSDVIQLLKLGDKTQALQFRLQINKNYDDSTIIIFEDIKKGSDLSDPSWLLDYNVVKGTVASNGASKDEIFVVLYNLNQNGGLTPGDYNNLFILEYEVAGLQKSDKEIKSSIQISDAVASTSQGFAIDIAPSRSEFRIFAKRK